MKKEGLSLIATQFQFYVKRYKGSFIRLYLKQDSYCQGILVGAWRNKYVMMVHTSRGFIFRYIAASSVNYIYPCKGLTSDKTSYIPKMVYSSVN